MQGALQLVHEQDRAGLESKQDQTDQPGEPLSACGLVLKEVEECGVASDILMRGDDLNGVFGSGAVVEHGNPMRSVLVRGEFPLHEINGGNVDVQPPHDIGDFR